MAITWTVDLYASPRGAGYELDRLEKGPDIFRMEGSLAAHTVAVEARTHVITGYLKGTIHATSSFSGNTWTGTMAGARYPGIYELARGDMPTKYHPAPGRHNFFGPHGPQFQKDIRQAIWDWVTDDFGSVVAPPGELTFFAGGRGFEGTVP
jgi:hypothetical protein